PARTANDLSVGGLVWRDDQSVAGRVHGEHRDRKVAVEGDVAIEVGRRRRIGLDRRAGVQGADVGVDGETGQAVGRGDLIPAWCGQQQASVVDARVPRRVAAGPRLDVGAVLEREGKV